MTDRELLELAAKAAGLRLLWTRPIYAKGDPLQADRPSVRGLRWNPLENDGDALRLAAKLKLGFVVYNDPNEVWCAQGLRPGVQEPYTDDALPAIRIAIVRAAAEIGGRA